MPGDSARRDLFGMVSETWPFQRPKHEDFLQIAVLKEPSNHVNHSQPTNWQVRGGANAFCGLWRASVPNPGNASGIAGTSCSSAADANTRLATMREGLPPGSFFSVVAAGSSSFLPTEAFARIRWNIVWPDGQLVHVRCSFCKVAWSKRFRAHSLSCVSSHKGTRKFNPVSELPNKSTVNAFIVPDNHGSSRFPKRRGTSKNEGNVGSHGTYEAMNPSKTLLITQL